MGIIHPNRRTALARADRWLMTGTRPSWTDGRPPACACRSSGAVPRPACTSGLWGNAGSRARIRRCSAGSGVGGGGIERGRTVSPNRSGCREARRSISAGPGPWSLTWSGSCVSRRCRSRVRTCAGWRRCRARPRNACAGVCRRCSSAWAWRPGSWCSTTPSAWATATPTARPPGPVCSPCSARTTGPNPGSATRIPATGRAAWRTRPASRGAIRWCRCRRPRASGRRSACGSTTSASWPPNAGSRPSSKRWRPSSTPDGPSTGPQSPHAPDVSSRARAPRAARI